MSEFLIPGVPVDSLALPIAGEQTPPGFLITINGNNTTFPVQGDLLFNVDKGVGHLNNPANNELMAYTRNNVAPPTGCGPATSASRASARACSPARTAGTCPSAWAPATGCSW